MLTCNDCKFYEPVKLVASNGKEPHGLCFRTSYAEKAPAMRLRCKFFSSLVYDHDEMSRILMFTKMMVEDVRKMLERMEYDSRDEKKVQ